MEQRKRTRRLRPGDMPIFYKILLGVVGMVMLALGVTTYVNARALQADLREKIGLEFAAVASAHMDHLADILSEQLTILQSITLINAVKTGVAAANLRYEGDGAAIETALLATDRDTERAEALINEMIGETRNLVEQHWPDIEVLAKRLLVKGRVNFLETEDSAS